MILISTPYIFCTYTAYLIYSINISPTLLDSVYTLYILVHSSVDVYISLCLRHILHTASDWPKRPEPARPDHPQWTRSGTLSHHQTSGSTNSERSSKPRSPLIGQRIWGDAAGPTSNRHPLRPFASFSWGLPSYLFFSLFSFLLLYSLSLCPFSTSIPYSILLLTLTLHSLSTLDYLCYSVLCIN